MKYDLTKLSTKNKVKGKFIIVHGVGGVGKSTLGIDACLANEGLMILGEDGINELNSPVLRTPVMQNWAEFLSTLGSLVTDEHDFKMIVIDTLDTITDLLERDTVINYFKGDIHSDTYKARYPIMIAEMHRALVALDMLRDKGIDVMVLVHSVIETIKAPDLDPYQHWCLKLPGGPKTSMPAMLFDHSDYTLFARWDRNLVEGKVIGKTRVLMSEWDSAYEAKTRKKLPEKMLLNWSVLEKELNKKEVKNATTK